MYKKKVIICFVVLILTITLSRQLIWAAGIASHIYSALRTIEEIKIKSDDDPNNKDLQTLRDLFFDNDGNTKDHIVWAYVTGATTPYALGTVGLLLDIGACRECSYMYYGDTGLLYSAILSFAGESYSEENIALAMGCINHYFVAKYTHPIVNMFDGDPYGMPGTKIVIDFDLNNGLAKKDVDGYLKVLPDSSLNTKRHAFFESYLAKDTLFTHNVALGASSICENLYYYAFQYTHAQTMAKIIRGSYIYLWGTGVCSSMTQGTFEKIFGIMHKHVLDLGYAHLQDMPITFDDYLNMNMLLKGHLVLPDTNGLLTFKSELSKLGTDESIDYSSLCNRFDQALTLIAPEETLKALLRAAPFINIKDKENLLSCLTVRNLRLQNINLDTGRVMTQVENQQHNIPLLIGGINPDITKAYVTNRGGNSIQAFEIQRVEFIKSTIMDTDSVPVGIGPESVIFDPTGRFAWVANTGDNTLSLIDTIKANHPEIDIKPSDSQLSRLYLENGGPKALSNDP